MAIAIALKQLEWLHTPFELNDRYTAQTEPERGINRHMIV